MTYLVGDLVTVIENNLYGAVPGDYHIVRISDSGVVYTCVSIGDRPCITQGIHFFDLHPSFCPFPLPSKLERLVGDV